MFKRIFFWGLTAGIFSAVASVIYQQIHEYATYSEFHKVVNLPVLIAINIMACLLAAFVFWAVMHFSKGRGEFIFNLLFSMASFASVMFPITTTLPLDVESPEMFTSLVIPMHFFPAIAWFTFRPLFAKNGFQPTHTN
ncbi:MAG: hypothetical protein H7Y31_09525 [Chitinophagaceae bacterium]|nr:hypothetical protein [Chitinophagaceae bacterium]